MSDTESFEFYNEASENLDQFAFDDESVLLIDNDGLIALQVNDMTEYFPAQTRLIDIEIYYRDLGYTGSFAFRDAFDTIVPKSNKLSENFRLLILQKIPVTVDVFNTTSKVQTWFKANVDRKMFTVREELVWLDPIKMTNVLVALFKDKSQKKFPDLKLTVNGSFNDEGKFHLLVNDITNDLVRVVFLPSCVEEIILIGTALSFMSLKNISLQNAVDRWEKEHNKKGKSVTFDVIGIDEFEVSHYMPLHSILQKTGEDGIVIVFHLDSEEKEKIDVSKHNIDLKKEMMGCNVSA